MVRIFCDREHPSITNTISSGIMVWIRFLLVDPCNHERDTHCAYYTQTTILFSSHLPRRSASRTWEPRATAYEAVAPESAYNAIVWDQTVAEVPAEMDTS